MNVQMNMFHADLVGILEIVTIAAGFVVLHFAERATGAEKLRWAGWTLILGGAAIGACTLYFTTLYWWHGMFGGMHMG